ncbi:hypothetical protein K503DRAFT_58375 [Rhizopogon vinicolor AM-OR11-026]|uniref:Uncharacterized protein n=1 Tax=Rhizopogon vinicolor AM-OR11-026 TaxID=1314800 RepID=A0A1B7MGH6_9AGAM|nr:hypothetical protein K503DRAFT_58375 [Rhizopogon vinicolor AM-OR11-026]
MSTLLPRMLDQPHNSPLALAIRLPRSLMCPAPTCQPLLTRSWRSSVTTPPNHGATLDTGIPPSPPPQGATRSSSSSGPVKKSRKMQVRKGRNGRICVRANGSPVMRLDQPLSLLRQIVGSREQATKKH